MILIPITILFSVIYKNIAAEDFTTAGIAVASLDTSVVTHVAEQGVDPTYATTGHVVYAQQGTRGEGTLVAVPFDPERLEVLGSAVRLVQGVRMPGSDQASYTFSKGQLVYAAASAAGPGRQQIVSVDRQGNSTIVHGSEHSFAAVRLSPDGSQIAVEVRAPRPAAIWLYDVGGGTFNPLTDGGSPLWTPDGEKVLYRFAGGISWRDVDFSSEPELLVTGFFPISWSNDGKQLLMHEQIAATQQRRIGVMTIDGDRKVFYPLDLDGQLNQQDPMVSPDGRWVAYVSPMQGARASGRNEVYVRPFPSFGSRTPVSNAGGHSPMWGRDATELFYIEDQRMMVAHVETEPDFRVPGEREELFSVATFNTGLGYRTLYDYDPAADRFLMVENMDRAPGQFTVIVNWFEELKQRVPTDGSR